MNGTRLNSSSRSSLPAGRVGPWWRVGIAVVSLCAGMVCLAPAAHAADRCVNPAGTSPCTSTIQAAVTAAASGDTITIASGTYLEHVVINGKVLTLRGGGAARTIVDGSATERVIRTTVALTLTDLTVQNGLNNSTGGGVYVSSGSLTLDNVDVLSNTASGSGGGVWASGAMTVTGGLFQNNLCTGSSCNGGGLYGGGTLVVSGTKFVSNTAQVSGGGSYNINTAQVTQAEFRNNTCAGGTSHGGGMFSGSGLTLDNTLVMSNTAITDAGGFYVNGPAEVSGGLFQANTCTGATCTGGGLYIGGEFAITGTQFIENGAVQKAGAVYGYANGTVDSATFLRNHSTNGAGLYASAKLTVTNSVFIANTASYGGGIYQNGSRDASIVNALFARNTATSQGAALHLGSSGVVTVAQTTIASPTVGGGAAIYVNSGTVQITNTVVASYTLGISRGGGTVTSDYNFFSRAPTTVITGSHSISGTQYLLFADAAADDYGIALGSPAPAHGLNLGVETDLNGAARSDPPTIGAYEGTPYPYLRLTKTVAPATEVAHRGVLTYTLNLVNDGSLADAVRFTDTLPADVSFGAWITAPVGVNQEGQDITWTGTLPDLNAISMVFTVTHDSAYSSIITNTGWYSGSAQAGAASAGVKVEDTPACFATPDDGATVYQSDDASALQAAVAAASADEVVKVAGRCAGTGQTLTVPRALTLAGGYTTTNWLTAYPDTQPTTLDAQGSGRVVNATAALTLTNLTVQNGNRSGTGGGVNASASAPLVLNNVNVFSSTSGTSNGGGVYAGNTLTVTGGLFENNRCTGSCYGGGLYASSKLVVTGTLFLSNTTAVDGGVATGSGGGLYANTVLTVTNAQFIANRALQGGAIYQGGTNGWVANTLFARNSAGFGAGLYSAASGVVSILQSTIASPTVGAGPAIFVNAGSVGITDTIVASYTASIQTNTGTVSADYDQFYNAPTSVNIGSHSITGAEYQLFVDAEGDNYRPVPGEPGSDHGINLGVSTDLDGTLRRDPPTIGAYEAEYKPDLQLAKTVAPAADVAFGGIVTFTVRLDNAGAQAVTDASITDTLPTGAAFAYWVTQPAGADNNGGRITWNGVIGARSPITVAFAVSNTASGGAVVTNTAVYSGAALSGSATASYTATSNYYPAHSGTWSEVFGPCAGECNYVIPTGITVTLDADLNLAGNFTVEPGAAFNANGKTVTLTGSSPQTLTGNPLNFYNLVLNKTNKTDRVTIVGKLKAGKKLTITKGSLISASDYGDVEIAAEGVMTLTHPISIGGSFTNSGQLNTAGFAVNFDGWLEQGAGPNVEQDLTLNVLTFFDDLNVMTGTTLVEAVTDDNAYLTGALTNYGVIRKTQPISGPAQYYFGLAGAYAEADMEVDAAEVGTLTVLQVDRIDSSPPGASGAPGAAPLYWQITPIGAGYNVTVTLPHAGLTNPSACRRTAGSSWECGQSAFDATTVTRRNVTAFSDWAVYDLQPTTTTLAAGPNPAVFGQIVAFTATVQPADAGGHLQFFVDGAGAGSAQQIGGGQAVLTATALAVGHHTITATTVITAGGYSNSEGAMSGFQVVGKAGTAATLESGNNPSGIGQAVVFTATFTPVAPGAGTPTGVVTFTVDSAMAATATLDTNGSGTYTTAALAAGSHNVGADYGGDAHFSGSTDSLTQVVDKTGTRVTVSADPNPSVYGQRVAITATVVVSAPGTGIPTGIITFTADGSAIIGCNPLTLIDAQATCTTSGLAAGSHAITAEYVGDATFLGSTAPAVDQVVQALPVAVNDAAGTQQATPVTVAVLANDINPAGGELVVAEITTPAGHGAAEIAPDGKTVLYTPAEGFAGLDSFVYVARDKNGNSDDALAAIVVTAKSQTDEPPQIEAVDPLVNSTKPFTSPNAGVEVQLPAGFFTGTLTEKDILFLSYTAVVTPTEQTHTPPGNLRFGNFEFDLTLFLNNEPQHGDQFAAQFVAQSGAQFAVPISVTINYNPAVVVGIREDSLQVYYWNGSAWAMSGITVIGRDHSNHTIMLATSHLGHFAFFADLPTDLPPGPEPDLTHRLYLPRVMYGGSAADAGEMGGDAEVDITQRVYLPVLQR